MTDSTTYTWPTPTGLDNSGNYFTTTSTWNSDYAERKQLETWLRILVERIDRLQDKIKELEGKLEGKSDGR